MKNCSFFIYFCWLLLVGCNPDFEEEDGNAEAGVASGQTDSSVLLNWSGDTDKFTIDAKKGIRLDETHYLRIFPAAYQFRGFHAPIMGKAIAAMEIFGLTPCREVGEIKSAIKEAILDGIIANEHDAAYRFMLDFAASKGLTPVK